MSTPQHPSAAQRAAGVVAGVVAVVVLALAALVLVWPSAWFPGAADCTVTVGSRSVKLSTAEAQKAASASAASVRRGATVAVAQAGLTDVIDLPEEDRRLVTRALTGRAPGALSCHHGGADEEETDRLDRAGLTSRAAAVRADLQAALARPKLGGFAPGGVSSGHKTGSAHYAGRAIDVFFRPVNARNRTRGWAAAHYLVAHAERLEISTVIYDGRIWTSRRSREGWRDYEPDTTGRSDEVAAVLEHRDHIHVDVAD